MFINFDRFFEVSQKTGDSYIKDYKISNGTITIHLVLDDDAELIFEFESNYLFMDKLSETNIEIENIGFLQCLKINDYLDIENGFYIPPESFSGLMKLRRDKLTLAIGVLAKDFDYIINFHGYKNIISFLINSRNQIKIKEV